MQGGQSPVYSPEDEQRSPEIEGLRAVRRAGVEVYRLTRAFPVEERYGLKAQIRRAAVWVPNNIVEGSARRTQREYAQFLRVALGSASETRYLLDVSRRLEMLSPAPSKEIEDRYDELVRGLQRLVALVEREAD